MGILVINDGEKEIRRCPHCDSDELYRNEYFEGPSVCEESDSVSLFCKACGRFAHHNFYGGSLVVESETDELDIHSDDHDLRADEGRSESRCAVCGAGNWVAEGCASFRCRRCGAASDAAA